MKPFNLEEAKQGKPVCTRDGRSVRIIATDIKNDLYPIAAVIVNPCGQEILKRYRENGKYFMGYVNDLKILFEKDSEKDSGIDLMMVDEDPMCPFKPFDKVLVQYEKGNWQCALFSNILEIEGKIYYYCNGISYNKCIPYNEETEHLIGTNDNAPEKYVIW